MKVNGETDELTRIDNKTPYYRGLLDRMAVYQRKILVSLALHGKPARINELTKIARIAQQNNVSAQVSRLVKQGLLEKQIDGSYFLSSCDPDLLRYVQLRLGGKRYRMEGKG